jgi:hypothetical protein
MPDAEKRLGAAPVAAISVAAAERRTGNDGMRDRAIIGAKNDKRTAGRDALIGERKCSGAIVVLPGMAGSRAYLAGPASAGAGLGPGAGSPARRGLLDSAASRAAGLLALPGGGLGRVCVLARHRAGHWDLAAHRCHRGDSPVRQEHVNGGNAGYFAASTQQRIAIPVLREWSLGNGRDCPS